MVPVLVIDHVLPILIHITYLYQTLVHPFRTHSTDIHPNRPRPSFGEYEMIIRLSMFNRVGTVFF